MTSDDRLPITVAIPTYRRERVLIETLEYLLALSPPPAEILVLDQTERHEATTDQRLAHWHAHGAIRWQRLDRPSIPGSMNQGLLKAVHEVVLFVDDDVRPEPELLKAHLAEHEHLGDALVAGRVIQPWQEGVDFASDPENKFAGIRKRQVDEFIGCNFSVKRASALAVGGFDENFVTVAYRFEAEFSHRFRLAGHPIWFVPQACLHHLKEYDGGTRAHGHLLTTMSPNHAVGKYYFALRTMPRLRCLGEFVWQPFRAVMTRHHLRKPWWIPASFLAEVRGIVKAISLWWQGPRYVVLPDGASRPW